MLRVTSTNIFAFTAFLVFFLQLFVSCGGAGVQTSGSSSVFIASTASSLLVGSNLQFTATGSSQSGSDISSQVTWNSSAPAVASISASGLVQGLTVGTTIITAALGTSVSNSIIVTVNSVSALSISIPIASQSSGTSQQLAAIATFSDASTQSVPSVVVWSSSNTSVLSISASGLATANTAGTATVSATYGGVSSGSVTVTVTNGSITVSTLVLYPGTPIIVAGNTQQMSAQSINSDGSTSVIAASSISWSTADAGTATVSATGLVTGVAGGIVAISGVYNGVTGTVSVTVKAAIYKWIYSSAWSAQFSYCSLSATGVLSGCGNTGPSYAGGYAYPTVWGNYLYAAYHSPYSLLSCLISISPAGLFGCGTTGTGLPAGNLSTPVFYGSSYAYASSTTTLYKCPLTYASGTLGACTSTYTSTIGNITPVAVNGNYIYLTMGSGNYVCSIAPSTGAISNCVSSGGGLNTGYMVFAGNYAYLGQYAQTVVQSCVVNPNGTLYPCINTGSNISGNAGLATDMTYLYVGNSSNNVTTCTLNNSTGILSACATSATMTTTIVSILVY